MKKTVFSILLIGFAFITSGQNYVDLVKFTHTQIPNSTFINNENISTPITQTKLSTSLPISLSDSLAFLTGIDYELHRLKINRGDCYVEFKYSNAQTWFNVKHNRKLSGTYLALPKIASDFG